MGIFPCKAPGQSKEPLQALLGGVVLKGLSPGQHRCGKPGEPYLHLFILAAATQAK